MGERVVLVTGAAGGIGRAAATRFRDRGDIVVLTDVDALGLEAVAAELRIADTVVADVTIVSDCERAVTWTIERHGRLDVLVNCAGIWVEGPTADTTEADYDRTMAVNLKGTFFMCRSAIPHLERTEGCIVNLSSDAGILGSAGAAVYSASKGGVSNLTRSLAIELAPKLVRVNAVCPNDVETPMLEGQARDYGGGDRQGYLAALLHGYPQGARARFIQPDEVAALIAYLASDEAAPITGACIAIDFGSTARL
ncbi:MAG TPA: SDR family oxidoreductase [Actinomycetota bacterium]|nr:SDR family oxidoreductase [Actinomycetota bacterium]